MNQSKKSESKMNILVMDFSGIYRQEQFWKEENIKWIDFQDISGTNCYCDDEALEEIKKRMGKYPFGGISFIDSGNYHYVSRIGSGMVPGPFRLLVFDNHTDMQLPAFGGILSCGGWIASTLDEVPNLKEVWLVGPDEQAYSQVEERYRSRVKFLSREERKNSPEREEQFLNGIPSDLPLYLSIDKDVLCKADASTTWSQGDMTLEELLQDLKMLAARFSREKGKIIQVDICGECDPKEDIEEEKNDLANKRLLDLLKGIAL